MQTASKEEDGLQYLAGWIAKYLGKYSYLHQIRNEQSHNLPSWVSHLSFGGLTEPAEKWLQEIRTLEKLFNKYFGRGINNTKQINCMLLKSSKSKHQSMIFYQHISDKEFVYE